MIHYLVLAALIVGMLLSFYTSWFPGALICLVLITYYGFKFAG